VALLRECCFVVASRTFHKALSKEAPSPTGLGKEVGQAPPSSAGRQWACTPSDVVCEGVCESTL
jgi:hypothetical protein